MPLEVVARRTQPADHTQRGLAVLLASDYRVPIVPDTAIELTIDGERQLPETVIEREGSYSASGLRLYLFDLGLPEAYQTESEVRLKLESLQWDFLDIFDVHDFVLAEPELLIENFWSSDEASAVEYGLTQ